MRLNIDAIGVFIFTYICTVRHELDGFWIMSCVGLVVQHAADKTRVHVHPSMAPPFISRFAFRGFKDKNNSVIVQTGGDVTSLIAYQTMRGVNDYCWDLPISLHHGMELIFHFFFFYCPCVIIPLWAQKLPVCMSMSRVDIVSAIQHTDMLAYTTRRSCRQGSACLFRRRRP